MNEQATGSSRRPPRARANGGADRPAGYGEAPRFTVDKASKKAGKKNEAVLGPFTIRDLTVFGSTLILFIASLIPMFAVRVQPVEPGQPVLPGPRDRAAADCGRPVRGAPRQPRRRRSGSARCPWTSSAPWWRPSPSPSSSCPSRARSCRACCWPWSAPSVLFAATVLARLIPFFAGDFLDRAEVPAHVVARESAVPVRKPRAPKAPKAAKDDTAAQGRRHQRRRRLGEAHDPRRTACGRGPGPARLRVVRRSERAQLQPRARQLQRPVPRLRPRPLRRSSPPPTVCQRACPGRRPAPVVSSPATQAARRPAASATPRRRVGPGAAVRRAVGRRADPGCRRRASAPLRQTQAARHAGPPQRLSRHAGRRGSRGRPATAPPPR